MAQEDFSVVNYFQSLSNEANLGSKTFLILTMVFIIFQYSLAEWTKDEDILYKVYLYNILYVITILGAVVAVYEYFRLVKEEKKIKDMTDELIRKIYFKDLDFPENKWKI